MFLDALAAQLCEEGRRGQGQPRSREVAGEEGTGGSGDIDPLSPPYGETAQPSGRGLCVVLHDGPTPASSGSRALLRHLLLRCLLSSVGRVVVLSLTFPALHFQRLIDDASSASALRGLKAAAQAKLAVIDAFSGLPLCPSPPTAVPAPPLPCIRHHSISSSLDLSALTGAVVEGLNFSSNLSSSHPSPPSTSSTAAVEGHGVVFIDGLSSLLFHHPSSAVLSWLLSLRTLAGGLSLVVHCDRAVPAQLKASPQALAALHRLASTSLSIRAVLQEQLLSASSSSSPSTSSQCRLHFTVAVQHLKSSGRLLSTLETWTLPAEASAVLLSSTVEAAEDSDSSSPVDSVTSTLRSLLSSSSPSAVSLATTAPTAAAPTPMSTFNLSLSAKQRQAKAQLVLPYQHTGSARGGAGAVHFGQSGLHFTSAQSRIRDVENDQDSDEDEDVDDDLDI